MNQTRWTEREGEMLRRKKGWDSNPWKALASYRPEQGRRFQPLGHHFQCARTAAAALSFLLLTGCFGNDSLPPVTAIPTSAAACEAMRPSYPLKLVSYDSEKDTPPTVAEVKADNLRKKQANARFEATCK